MSIKTTEKTQSRTTFNPHMVIKIGFKEILILLLLFWFILPYILLKNLKLVKL